MVGKFTYALNRSQTCRLPAACFIRPQTTLDVAILLRVVRYAQSKFAIRSGGHNPNAGFGSVGANGVLIDLQDLDDLSLNSEEELTTGPGNRWIDIYNFLSNYKLGAIGGRDGDVGVPGFLLGGGMSFFPNLYGFGADNVKSFEIVLANSSIVDANANTNPDLFTALKGGASNFGIVVKFQIYTHPLHQIWYSLDLYAASDYAAILNATVQAQVAMETDPKLGLFVNINPEVIIVGKLYSEWTLPPSGFSSFEAITPVGVYIPATNGTLSELVDSIKIGSFPARRETYTVTHGVDLKLYTEIHKRYLSMLNTSIASSANLSYTIQPVGTAGVKAGAARGGNTLGLYPAAQSWHASLVEWTSEEDDTSAHGMVNTMGKSVEELSRNEKSYYPFQFMNDASYTQNPLASYGAQNLAKLRDVGKAYDPDGLFQTLQNSGFLLSRK
ncbi:FAD-binding domain-containing protein [Delitschia confertaspora ATCC 74209]|uniref:FAD-binding domain-containing protein n=1 Tax=Delitschia confertaspora ATCC 74209 TaxID=1513339 RepID=A0A9P4JHV7_9PLEO|nr:FAD-binding domain-containing protein [Delitschia confertaspora ATCC 74209]